MTALLENQPAELTALCEQFRVVRLEVFGSAVRGAFDRESDLDFQVHFNKKPGLSLIEQYFGFKEALGQLFRRPVDLLEEQALANPYLLKAIRPQRTLLYAA